MSNPQPSRTKKALVASVFILCIGALPTAVCADQIPLLHQDLKNSPVLLHEGYNYAPSVFRDSRDGKYQLYWCGFYDSTSTGGGRGDHILHAESENLTGPWHSRASSVANTLDVVLQPSNVSGSFDRIHACDPSVLYHDGIYYLYYGGLGERRSSGVPVVTKIGVATSRDGVSFQRAGAGEPIVAPIARDPTNPEAGCRKKYGVGQPSVTYRQPYFYMTFTNTCATGAKANGAGQYMIRSQDPLFSHSVEEFTEKAWVPHETREFAGAFPYIVGLSVDIAYDSQTDLFIVASNDRAGKTDILALRPDTLRVVDQGALDEIWGDGPGILTDQNRQVPRRSDCTRLEITTMVGADVASGTGNPWKWGLTESQALFDATNLCRSVSK